MKLFTLCLALFLSTFLDAKAQESPTCSRTVETSIDGKFQYLSNLICWRGAYLCFLSRGFADGKVYELDLANLKFKSNNLITSKQSLCSWKKMSEDNLLLCLKEGSVYSVVSIGPKSSACIKLPDNRELYQQNQDRHIRAEINDGWLFVLEGKRLMRWKSSKSGPEFQNVSSIDLPSSRGPGPIWTFKNFEQGKLIVACLGEPDYCIDLKTNSISRMPFEQTFGKIVYDQHGRKWVINSDYRIAPKKKSSSKHPDPNGGWFSSNETPPFECTLQCFDKEKCVFRTSVIGNRNFSNTNVEILDDTLIRMDVHRVVKSENWPHPPTAFGLVFFDRFDEPILWTTDEGVFKLENHQWKSVIRHFEFGAGELDGLVMKDGRYGLVSGGQLRNPEYEKMTIEDYPGIAIFKSGTNKFEIARFRFKSPK
jgi:hypothetical protein